VNGPSITFCRLATRYARSTYLGASAGMPSTTSSGLASVSRWGCCCQSFERAGPGAEALGAPRQDPTHEIGARPSATSSVVTGNATARSRISGLPALATLLAYVLTWPVVVGGLTLGQHIDRTKG
jgi:hypothetical protein